MTDTDHKPEVTPDIDLEFFSRPIYLGAIRRLLDSLCERMGLDHHQSARICLAVDEAICNVIRHGYDNSPDGRITLQLTRLEEEKSELLIEVLDRAKHADLDTIRSRNLDDVRPGGLGVHIINEIMETVEYSHRDGGGMKLSMRYPLGHNPKNTIENGDSDE
ncbi:MAG: ATP-binding protein [Phycisphaerales bacterium]|nr:ATP-binding protein [Phycisphaerales bacterium]|tara:strand:+ start:7670 stop:8155 length:486 start_codon:yes stop_codon:yes gene_type:complete